MPNDAYSRRATVDFKSQVVEQVRIRLLDEWYETFASCPEPQIRTSQAVGKFASKYLIPVPLIDLKFRNRPAEGNAATFNRRHESALRLA